MLPASTGPGTVAGNKRPHMPAVRMRAMKRTALFILFAIRATMSVAQQETNYLFAIYVTESSSWWHPETNADAVKLMSIPVLTDKNLLVYDWATHTMTLCTNATTRLPTFHFGLQCSNFVVVAEGKRCYVGAFCGYEDCAPAPENIPLVRVWSSTRERLTCLAMPIEIEGRGRRLTANDPRSDPRVKTALKKANKLFEQGEEHPNQSSEVMWPTRAAPP